MNEFDQPSIEQIFHPLHTRLYELRNGDIVPKGFYDEIEEYCEIKIKYIVANIFAYDSGVSSKVIDNTLTSIDELHASAENLITKAFDNNDLFITKKEALKDIRTELAYYRESLNKLKDQLYKSISTDRITKEVDQKEIELPDDFEFPKFRDDSVVKFDKYQSALLFYLLKEHGAINNFSALSLSKIISCLTGHSAQNIRQDALGKIWDVLKDKEKNKTIAEPNYNLIAIRNLLNEIISQLDDQIKLNDSPKL